MKPKFYTEKREIYTIAAKFSIILSTSKVPIKLTHERVRLLYILNRELSKVQYSSVLSDAMYMTDQDVYNFFELQFPFSVSKSAANLETDEKEECLINDIYSNIRSLSIVESYAKLPAHLPTYIANAIAFLRVWDRTYFINHVMRWSLMLFKQTPIGLKYIQNNYRSIKEHLSRPCKLDNLVRLINEVYTVNASVKVYSPDCRGLLLAYSDKIEPENINDVLRAIWAKNYREIKPEEVSVWTGDYWTILPKKKYDRKNPPRLRIPRQDRKRFLGIINHIITTQGIDKCIFDGKSQQRKWLIVGKLIHPKEYEKHFPLAVKFFEELLPINIKARKTWESEYHRLVKTKAPIVELVKFAASDQSKFKKLFDSLLAKAVHELGVEEGSSLILEALNTKNTVELVDLYKYYTSRLDPKFSTRLYRWSANRELLLRTRDKMVIRRGSAFYKSELPKNVLYEIINFLQLEILSSIATVPNDKIDFICPNNLYIDPKLDYITLPWLDLKYNTRVDVLTPIDMIVLPTDPIVVNFTLFIYLSESEKDLDLNLRLSADEKIITNIVCEKNPDNSTTFQFSIDFSNLPNTTEKSDWMVFQLIGDKINHPIKIKTQVSLGEPYSYRIEKIMTAGQLQSLVNGVYYWPLAINLKERTVLWFNKISTSNVPPCLVDDKSSILSVANIIRAYYSSRGATVVTNKDESDKSILSGSYPIEELIYLVQDGEEIIPYKCKEKILKEK